MTKINPHIFRAYDIRGIAMEDPSANTDRAKLKDLAPSPKPDLTPETMELIGKGTGTYMKRKYGTTNMLVGRDNRLHGEKLQQAFIQGVLSTGINVEDASLSTSPLIYYGVCRFGMDSGVNITASHNPKEYNGVKIVGKNAHSVCGEELQEILKLIQTGDFEIGEGKLTPTSNFKASRNRIFTTYLADISSRIKLARPMKVVVDAGNGTAGIFAPELLRALGCEVTEIFCEPDGNFPNHEANPEDEANTRDLAAKVVETGSDIGIGFDGDGDRVGIVDENGKHYSADYLIILLTRDLLANMKGAQIVFDVKVSQILIDEITKLGGVPVMSKTGHSFIESRMHEIGAPLAGEISGHLFFGKDHYNYYGFDDALFGAGKILEILSQSDKKFSAQFTDLPQMATTPEFKAHCPDDKKFEIVKKLQDTFSRTHKCVTIDGVRVNFDKKSWGAVRCSNTSPNLTLRFEAENEKKLKEIQRIMVNEIRKHPEVSLTWYKE